MVSIAIECNSNDGMFAGHPGEEHDILWMRLTPDHPVMCEECGNWYKLELVTPEEFEKDESLLQNEDPQFA